MLKISEINMQKVEVIILPFMDKEDSTKVEKKGLRGALSKYKNEALQAQENDAWSKAVVDVGVSK